MKAKLKMFSCNLDVFFNYYDPLMFQCLCKTSTKNLPIDFVVFRDLQPLKLLTFFENYG